MAHSINLWLPFSNDGSSLFFEKKGKYCAMGVGMGINKLITISQKLSTKTHSQTPATRHPL